MNIIDKDKLISDLTVYINNSNRQRILKDNPIMQNMLNDVLNICNQQDVELQDVNYNSCVMCFLKTGQYPSCLCGECGRWTAGEEMTYEEIVAKLTKFYNLLKI